MNGPKEPVVVGGPKNPQTTEGKIATGMLNVARMLGVSDKLKELQVTMTTKETTNTNGAGDTKSEGVKVFFTGPDANKLEAMETEFQGKVNSTFDQRFSDFASGQGVDFNSMTPEGQAQFKVDNVQTAGAIMMGVQNELGPSPKQQMQSLQQELVNQGVVVPVKEVKDLPVIREKN